MKKLEVNPHKSRLKWLVRGGWALICVGLLLIVLSTLLPYDLFDGPHQYYRVVPTERGWGLEAILLGFGVLLLVIAQVLRSMKK